MKIPNWQMEQLIDEYKVYIDKIINHTYYHANPDIKDELRHVGMIGLWKGITEYYKRGREEVDRKELVDTICAYIRYEMADLFSSFSIIKISGKQRRNFMEMRKAIAANPDASEECLESMALSVGLRYDWYVKTKALMCYVSLDESVCEDAAADILNIIPYYEKGMKTFVDKSYIDYIVDSALFGIKKERDKKIIKSWLCSIYCDRELRQTELATLYDLSPSMVGVIINRFIDICRFVRDCEREFCANPNGYISFPEIAEKTLEYNEQKIPGVRWVLRNRKWKAEITVGKNNNIFIGFFENYKDAIRARRDAEIKYRGGSNIEV